MSEFEIELTRAYLRAAGQDPVAALIRSVRDLTRTHLAAARDVVEPGPAPRDAADEPMAGRSLAEAA